MRVMILANNDVGLYKFRKELIEKLLEDHEVYICLPDGDFIPKLCSMGARFISCDLLDRHGTNPAKELRLIAYYRNLLKKIKPDIVFTYTIKPNVYGGIACASLGICYVENITGLGTAVENDGFMQKITLALYKIGLRKAQKVFFQNAENMRFFVSHKIAIGKQDLLPGSGVNLQRFRPIEYPPDGVIRFAFISRIMREKGIEQYLEAAEYIKEKYPNVEFHVCGFCEQAYEEKLKEVSNKGVINYHGMVRDVKTILKDVSCTVHPTYYPEGISNVLLESCACARPIITTDRAGCREVIDDGINGFVVKQKDSQDLIEKIEKFLALSNEERKAMGLAGRAKVEKEFNRQIVVEKYMKELQLND